MGRQSLSHPRTLHCGEAQGARLGERRGRPQTGRSARALRSRNGSDVLLAALPAAISELSKPLVGGLA